MTREFRLLASRERAHLVDRLSPVLEGWSRDWLGRESLPSLKTVRTTDSGLARDAWRTACVAREDDVHWAAARVESADSLVALLFGARGLASRSASPVGLGWRVARRAVGDLARRCLDARAGNATAEQETDESHPAPGDAFRPGSGACELGFAVADAGLYCLLSPAVAAALLADAPASGAAAPPVRPLALRARALDGQRVTVRAVVGRAELGVDALASLAVGDVVALDQRIDRASALEFPDLDARCDGYLCELDGHSAVMIGTKRAAGDEKGRPEE